MKISHLYWLLSVSLFLTVINPVSPADQYVEPLLFGMKVNLPYDMANLFNRFPFQGGLSVLLAVTLAGILFFGVITAPFGYMFGVPSEKYILGDFSFHKGGRMFPDSLEPDTSSSSVLLDYVTSVKGSPRTIFSDQRQLQSVSDEEPCCQTFLHYFDSILAYLDYWEPGFLEKWKPMLNVLRNRLGGKVGKDIVNTMESTLNTKYAPEYMHSMFYMISEDEKDVRNPVCQQRMICHAHGAMQYLSPTILKVYQRFRYLNTKQKWASSRKRKILYNYIILIFFLVWCSKKLKNIPPGYPEAMKIGMYNDTLCSEVYSACTDNAFTLALKSYMSLLPERTQINGMPRRKHKMYNKMNFL